MKASKEFAKEQGWESRISFQKTPKITVKLVSDEKTTITGNDGKPAAGISVKVEMDGEPKGFFTTSQALIQQLSDYNEGDVVTIEMKKIKTDQGFRSTYKVSREGEVPAEGEEGEIEAKDIPF